MFIKRFHVHFLLPRSWVMCLRPLASTRIVPGAFQEGLHILMALGLQSHGPACQYKICGFQVTDTSRIFWQYVQVYIYGLELPVSTPSRVRQQRPPYASYIITNTDQTLENHPQRPRSLNLHH
jgi:hypothetical protein